MMARNFEQDLDKYFKNDFYYFIDETILNRKELKKLYEDEAITE